MLALVVNLLLVLSASTALPSNSKAISAILGKAATLAKDAVPPRPSTFVTSPKKLSPNSAVQQVPVPNGTTAKPDNVKYAPSSTSIELETTKEYHKLISHFNPVSVLSRDYSNHSWDELLKYQVLFKKSRNGNIGMKISLFDDKGSKHPKQSEFKNIVSLKFPEFIMKLEDTDDPCEKLSKATFFSDYDQSIPYNFVRDCYLVFPYIKSDAKDTIDKIKRMLDFYVFLDIAPRKLNLSQLANGDYKSDFYFQEKLACHIKSLYDGHLIYTPNCYRPYYFYQPIELTSIVDGNDRTRIFVSFIDDNIAPDLKQYEGQEVTFISNAEYIDKVSSAPAQLQIIADLKDGSYRSARTRFNHALIGNYLLNDKLIKKYGGLIESKIMPENPHVTYRFKNINGTDSEFISVPWYAYKYASVLKDNFENKTTYLNAYCKPIEIPKNESDSSINTEPDPKIKPLYDDKDITYDPLYELLPEVPRNTEPGDNFFEVIFLSSDFCIYGHHSTKTAVLHLYTFKLEARPNAWMFGLYAGLNRLHKKGYNKLLLDLSNNDGGNICLAYNFVRYIDRISDSNYQPERIHSELSAIRYSKDLINFSKKAKGHYNIFSKHRYLNSEAKNWTFQNDAINFTQKIKKPYFDEIICKGQLVKNLTISCESSFTKLIRNVPLKIDIKNITVLSNGICGSSCAVVLNALNRRGIKTVALTHSTMSVNFPMSIQAFAGGESINSDGLLDNIASISEDYIQPFRTSAILGFAFRGIGMPQDDGSFQMLEFASWPADAELRITNENVLRPKLIWNTAIKKAFKSDFMNYPIFKEEFDATSHRFNVSDVAPNNPYIDNILSFLLTWDGGNCW